MSSQQQIIEALKGDIPLGQTADSYARLALLEWAMQQDDLADIPRNAHDLCEQILTDPAPTSALQAFHAMVAYAGLPMVKPRRRGGRASRLKAQRAA
jgi:hypothetical protein